MSSEIMESAAIYKACSDCSEGWIGEMIETEKESTSVTNLPHKWAPLLAQHRH